LWYSCFGSAAPSCKRYSSHGLSVSEGFKLDIYIIINSRALDEPVIVDTQVGSGDDFQFSHDFIDMQGGNGGEIPIELSPDEANLVAIVFC